MRKIYIGDDQPSNREDLMEMASPKTFEDLEDRVGQMDIYADVERYGRKGRVKVMENAGTSMMLAGLTDDLFWLQQNSYEKKRVGSMTVYYFSFPT